MGVGWDPRRVAEVLVESVGGVEERGSGYRVTDSLVLTSAHVVRDALRVRVRFEAGTTVPSSTEWEATVGDPYYPGLDIALLPMKGPVEERPILPVEYGRIGYGLSFPAATAVGFPVSQFRPGQGSSTHPAPAYRESKQAIGNLAPLGHLKSGSFEFHVLNAPGQSEGDWSSSWEGMSGAAVWVAERLVGVVVEDFQPVKGSALTVVPLALLWDHDESSPQALTDLFRCGDPDSWIDLSVGRTLQSVLADHHRQTLSLVPREGLREREAELMHMLRFCHGDQPYYWWKAGPWAGKSALMASFASTAPAHLRIASFFIDSQREGRRDSSAFRQALIPQLDAIAGALEPTTVTPGAEDQGLARSLESAARVCVEQGKTLVVLVDALDEDEWVEGSAIGPSIASLLPLKSPAGTVVILSSRLNPGIPSDVPPHHPLRIGTVTRLLESSPFAAEVETRAVREIKRILSKPGVERDCIAIIALLGALSPDEIMAISSHLLFEIEETLKSSRILRAAAEEPDRSENSAYALSHTTLPDVATNLMGNALKREYIEMIHAAARVWHAQGWPEATPSIFLRSAYLNALAAYGENKAVVEFILDHNRQTRIFEREGNHYRTLNDIYYAQYRNYSSNLDLVESLRLCVARNELADVTLYIDERIPGLFVRAGPLSRATSLAMRIDDYDRRSQALSDVAVNCAASGQVAAALSHALTVADPQVRVRTLCSVAQALLGVLSDPSTALDTALSVAESIEGAGARSDAIATVAIAHAQASKWVEALRLAETITDVRPRFRAIEKIALAQAGFRLDDAAYSTVNMISDSQSRFRAFERVARQLWTIGTDSERGIASALEAAMELPPSAARDEALTLVADLQAHAGLLNDAIAAADFIQDPEIRSRAFADLATIATNEAEQGLCLDKAATSARRIQGVMARSTGLAAVAKASIAVGSEPSELLGEALKVSRLLSHPTSRWRVLSEISVVQAQAGSYMEARVTADVIADPAFKAEALTRVASSGSLSEHELAETLEASTQSAKGISSGMTRALALQRIAEAQARAGLQQEALATAGAIANSLARSSALLGVAKVSDDSESALEAAFAAVQAVHHPYSRAAGIAAVALAFEKAGRIDKALAAARVMTAPVARSAALVGLAYAQALSGKLEAARITAASILQPHERSEALLFVAFAQAQAGLDPGPLLNDVVAIALQISDPEARCDALVTIARGHIRAEVDAGAAIEAGLSAARSVVSPMSRSHALAQIALVQSEGGYLNEATATAQSIPQAYVRARALAGVARYIVNSHGNPEPALREALASAQTSKDREALLVVANAQLYAGMNTVPALSDALAALNGVSYRSSWETIGAVRLLIDLGLMEEAEAKSRSIIEPNDRSHALSDVAAAHIRAGHLAEALSIAQEISDAVRQSESMASLAIAEAESGNVRGALSIAHTIVVPSAYSRALSGIAQVQARTSRELSFETFKAAIEAAQGIVNSSDYTDAMERITLAQLEVDQVGNAFQSMHRNTKSMDSARIWRTIARELIDKGDVENARDALVFYVGVSTWVDVVGELCRVEAHAASHIEEALCPYLPDR